jgi:hypothetical protein
MIIMMITIMMTVVNGHQASQPFWTSDPSCESAQLWWSTFIFVNTPHSPPRAHSNYSVPNIFLPSVLCLLDSVRRDWAPEPVWVCNKSFSPPRTSAPRPSTQLRARAFMPEDSHPFIAAPSWTCLQFSLSPSLFFPRWEKLIRKRCKLWIMYSRNNQAKPSLSIFLVTLRTVTYHIESEPKWGSC